MTALTWVCPACMNGKHMGCLKYVVISGSKCRCGRSGHKPEETR